MTVGAEQRPKAGPVATLRGLLERPLASYYLLLACVGLLLIIGLVMVFSATSLRSYSKTGSAFSDVLEQVLFAAVGFVAFWFCQRLPVRTFHGIARIAIIVAFGLMLLVDGLGIATALSHPGVRDPAPVRLGPIYASELWLYVCGIQLQPVEIAKLALVLWGARVLVDKGPAIARFRELCMPLFPVAFALFALVGYNDLGSMVCLVVAFIGLLWAAGVRLRVFGAMGLTMLAGVATLVLLPGKLAWRIDRLAVFVNPAGANRSSEGYQYFAGLYAVANGGWFGVGLGEGRTKWGWLPNGHNDYIFAVIAEELGLVGCVVVLGLFAVLGYTGLRIARRVADPFRRLVAAAITVWFVGQAVINISGVVGLLPITGLPLPFISDGGTALVVALTAAGILLSFARAEPDAARALHARPPRRWVRLLWAPLPPLPRAHPDHGRGSRPGRSG